MNAEREFIDVCTLAAEIEDADFWVGYTTVEARFGVRLQGRNTWSVYVLGQYRRREEGRQGIRAMFLVVGVKVEKLTLFLQ